MCIMYKIIVLQLDTRSLVLWVCFVDRCRSFCPFSFGHCVVCPSIYRFWLPPFGIYKLFLYLSDKKKRTEISNQTDTLYKLNSCKLFGDELILFLRIHLIWIMKRKLKHFTCTKSGSLRFSQFSGCWLILSVYILMSFDFPFVRLLGVR
jgi:hypothetical protein